MIDIEYSLDMIRLKIKVPILYFNPFQALHLSFNPNVKYYEKFGFKEYRHNWNIREVDPFGKEFSYWLGYRHNSISDPSSSNLVIEFNPSKCSLTGLLDEILSTFYKFDCVIVSSLDIAMDFKININSLIIDKYRKQVYKLYDEGGDNKTHYLGKGDGRIKIYNKARELGIEGDLTRCEITKKIGLDIGDIVLKSYEADIEVFPLGVINDIDIADKSLMAIYYSVLNGYPISDLSRDYKNRIRKLINDNNPVVFDKKKISQTIRQWFQGYKEIYIKD